MLYIYTDVG